MSDLQLSKNEQKQERKKYKLSEIADESREIFKNKYGRLLTADEAVRLTDYVREYYKKKESGNEK